MNKKGLTERDICTKFINPAVEQSGWDVLSQIREQVHFTKGAITVRGKLVTRGKICNELETSLAAPPQLAAHSSKPHFAQRSRPLRRPRRARHKVESTL